MNQAKNEREKTGTDEWISKNNKLNIQKGCIHDCSYCYARTIADRFNWKKGDWNTIELKQIHQIRKRESDNLFMFPTSHDIFPLDCSCELSKEIKSLISEDQAKKIQDSYNSAMNLINHVLHVGNRLLLVTKPHVKYIEDCCNKFKKFKDQIIFRFTITSMNQGILNAFEKHAPTLNERLECIKIALENKFNTTISIEPFLDFDPMILIKTLLIKFRGISEIWLGSMSRCPNTRFTEIEFRYLNEIYNRNNLIHVKQQITELNDPRIKLKHSFRRILDNPKRKDLLKEIAGPGYVFPGTETNQFPVRIEEGCIVYYELLDQKKVIHFVDLPRNRR